MSLWKKWFGSKTPKAETPAPPESIPNEERIARSLAQLEPFKRTAYLPRTEAAEPAFSAHSKFGGYPYLRHAGDWPRCAGCGKHLQLFLQLDGRQLPPMGRDGTIQLFYCAEGSRACDELHPWEAFSPATVCRRIEVDGPSAEALPEGITVFPERRITGWKAADDYPHYDEHEELGIVIDDDDYELLQQEELGQPIAGDKLYGWPFWTQSWEYTSDRKTGTLMDCFFQIASEDNLPYMFGDDGVGHLHQSPDDPNELAFTWACY